MQLECALQSGEVVPVEDKWRMQQRPPQSQHLLLVQGHLTQATKHLLATNMEWSALMAKDHPESADQLNLVCQKFT